MAENDAWTTIESDPGVFTELLNQMGVKGVQVEEVYSMDSENLAHLRPVYGLVFLFKWQEEKDERPVMSEADYTGRVFFARQVITNACATQALLAILLNRHDIELGKELTDLRTFTADFPPDLRGHAISNCESIRRAHNSFRPPNPIVSDVKAESSKDEDAYHFIAYVPTCGVLYELDGLRAGPISLCSCTEEDWLALVQPFIQQRIERYSASEIRFNLMALIRDRRMVWHDELTSLRRQQDEAAASGHGERQGELAARMQAVEERLTGEEERARNWHADNVRRRHNYIPFVYNVLRILAEEGKMQLLLTRAQISARNVQIL